MIITFACKDTQALFNGQRVARFANIAAAAMRKLQQVNAATTLELLRAPPDNRLEALTGDRAGQHPHQRSMARVLCVVRRPCRCG